MTFLTPLESDLKRTDFRPITGPETGYLQNYRIAQDRVALTQAPSMELMNITRQIAPYVKEYEESTGKRVPRFFNREEKFTRGEDGVYYNSSENIEYQGLQETLKFLHDRNNKVPTWEQIIENIPKIAKRTEAHYFDTTGRQTNLGLLGEVIGEVVEDVAQVVYAPQEGVFWLIGKRAGWGFKALVKAGLMDSAAAAMAVGSRQPAIKYFREKHGLEYTTDTALKAVGGAALAAFGLRVGVQGTARGLRRVGGAATDAGMRRFAPSAAFGRALNKAINGADMAAVDEVLRRASSRDLFNMQKSLEDSGVQFNPEIKSAAQLLEREADIVESNPFRDDQDFAAVAEHEQRMNAALDAHLNNTNQVDLPPSTLPVKETGVHHFDELNTTLQRIDLDKVEVDAKLFQFKEGGNEFGVTDRLAGVEKWDPIKAGTVTIYEFMNGRQFIADGHQRLGLAKSIRSKDPAQDVNLYGFVLREADGISPDQAAAIAAMTNIAQGTGSYLDAAKVLRVNPSAIAELPQQSQLVRVAADLVELSDEAFGLVVNDVVKPTYAAIVGRLEKDAAKQMAIMRLLAKTEPANITQAEAIVRQARDMEFTKTTQDSLFGEEVMLESLFAERAKVLDEALKILQRDQNTFANLVRNEKTIAEGGNKLETESNKQRAETNGQAKQIIQTLSSRTGDISSALSEAARRFKETGKAAPAARDFAEFVRGGIERGDFAGVSVEPPIRTFEPAAQNDRLAAGPAAEQIDAFSTPTGPKADAALDRLEDEFVESITAQPTDADLISRGEIAPDYRYYLEPTSDSIDIPIQNIVPIRRRPDGVANAKMFMAEAALGDKAKRGPISVKDNGDGTYELLDGNSTYAIADEAGMPELPARVLTDQEFAAEVAQKNAKKMLEMGPGAKKKRLVLAQDLSGAELENLASILHSRQAYASIDDIMQRNEAFNAELNTAVQKVAGEHKVDYFAGPLKERDRVKAKIAENYAGQLDRIADVSRATVAISTPDEADAFIKSLAKTYHVVDEGYKGKARGTDAYSGYLDKKLKVINKDGIIGEVIIIERNLYDAKHVQGGHNLYKIVRGDPNPTAIIAELPNPEMRARLEPLSGDELMQAAQREAIQLNEAAQSRMGSEFSEIADSVLGSMPATTSRVSNSDAVSSSVRVSDTSTRADISPQAPLDEFQVNAVPSSRSTEGQIPSNEKNLINKASTTNQKIASEITDAGEQTLMPGVEGITGAQRAQAAVDAPMTGGDAPMDVGLFDTAARAQADLLDSLVPTGRMVDGEAERATARSLFEEIESDKSMLNRLKDCV